MLTLDIAPWGARGYELEEHFFGKVFITWHIIVKVLSYFKRYRKQFLKEVDV